MSGMGMPSRPVRQLCPREPEREVEVPRMWEVPDGHIAMCTKLSLSSNGTIFNASAVEVVQNLPMLVRVARLLQT